MICITFGQRTPPPSPKAYYGNGKVANSQKTLSSINMEVSRQIKMWQEQKSGGTDVFTTF